MAHFLQMVVRSLLNRHNRTVFDVFYHAATSSSFIMFRCLRLFHAPVVFQHLRQRRAGLQPNPRSYVGGSVIGVIICAYLLSQPDDNAITLGCPGWCWVCWSWP